MDIRKVTTVYFSPTGNTKKIVHAIAKGTGLEKEEYDFTRLSEAKAPPVFGKNDLVVMGAPVYVGRVPVVILDYLKSVKGDATPVVLVGTYGNRNYDDFLTEFEDLTRGQGFLPVGAAVFTAEHSFSTELGTGRPNAVDISAAEGFGKKAIEKLAGSDNVPALEMGKIPGGRPYRDPYGKAGQPFGPVVNDRCTNCGLCASLCPAGAINPENVSDINADKCIWCRACARSCPAKAIEITTKSFWEHTEHLIEEYGKIDWEPVLVI
jgi:ferredoxin/flavodoxin